MIYKVGEHLFVGNQDDFYDQLHCGLFTDNDAVILAGKVFHKKFARIAGTEKDGYDGDMDDQEVERMGCYRDKPCDMLVLNLLDVDSEDDISQELVELAVRFAQNEIVCENKNVAIFDTDAKSAAPSIAFLTMTYLAESNYGLASKDVIGLAESFKILYPPFSPKTGISEVSGRVYQKIMEGKL